jgi:hypothetical protein
VGDLPIIVSHSFTYLMLFFAFTNYIVELVFVLSYIWSRVCGSIEYNGTWCGDYYLTLRRLTTLIRRKILDSAVNVLWEVMSARGALGHMDYCGTRRSDNPVRAL